MAFMVPEYVHDTFYRINNYAEGGLYTELSQVLDEARDILLDGVDVEITPETGWFCRLSAPGYMDATDWDGPFETEQDARDHVEDYHEVDADTGEDLFDSDRNYIGTKRDEAEDAA